MKENNEKKEQKLAIEKEDNTYSGVGMLYGVAVGSIVGAIFNMFFDSITYFPICLSVGMMFGLAIGSSIKKDKKKK